MQYYEYGIKEIEYLKKKDKKLGKAIERIGLIDREITPNLFPAIIDSIISQQISSKAAETVFRRLSDLVGELTPVNIVNMNVEKTQQCGMTLRKAGYIRNIAQKVLAGELDLEELPKLSDEEIINKLVALNGIGIWTAEMLLIFALCRPDIVSYGDLAIRRGIMNLYGLKELSKDKFNRYRKRYSPYGTVASLYLWKLSAEKLWYNIRFSYLLQII